MKRLIAPFLLFSNILLSSCSDPTPQSSENSKSEMLEKQAIDGDVLAQYNLGTLYLENGRMQNIQKAIYWFTQAAENDDADAQYNLGVVYTANEYALKNLDKAKYWYEKAAAQNHKMALNNLANFYREGVGHIQRNDIEAVRLYKLSADQGYSPAQVNLGSMYLNGYGTEVDIAQALKLYELAAQQGDADGQYLLGSMYAEGLGIAQDFEKAKFWFNKSQVQGNTAAKDRLITLENKE